MPRRDVVTAHGAWPNFVGLHAEALMHLSMELPMPSDPRCMAGALPTLGEPGPRCAVERRRLSPTTAFHLEASITLTCLAGSSAPTPLYAIYQARWGFSPTMMTVVFGIYALAVLASLLVVGRLSDHVGRRPVLIGAALAQAVAMLVFATASGLPDLLVGRVLQGLSAGAAVAAVGAGLLDLDRARGTVANAVAPMMGTALGGVVAGVLVHFLPAPTHLVFELLGVVFVAQAIGVGFIDETVARRPGALASALASLRPSIAVPSNVRGRMVRAVPALVAVWALGGFYASLGPTLVRTLAGSDGALLGGVALFVMAACGAIAVVLLRGRDARTLMRIGGVALVLGVSVALAGEASHSLATFLVGTAIAGIGFGTGFQGALRLVVEALLPHQRAGGLSALFVVSYLSMGLPAILAGMRFAATRDITATARELGFVVIALALLALVGTFRRFEPR